MCGVRVTVVLIVLIDGWFVQSRYLEGRYRSPDLIAADIDAFLAGTQNSTVAFIGASEAYPLYGFDLSNRVDQMLKRRTTKRIETCPAWRRAARGYDYVVLSIPQLGIMEYFLPPDDWFDTDPASKELATEGRARLYRVDGNLDPRGCAAEEP